LEDIYNTNRERNERGSIPLRGSNQLIHYIMNTQIKTALELIESDSATDRAHGQGMLEVINSLPSCLNWSADDFDGDQEKMEVFFRHHGETIIEFINDLK